jgi:hypothetical protein
MSTANPAQAPTQSSYDQLFRIKHVPARRSLALPAARNLACSFPLSWDTGLARWDPACPGKQRAGDAEADVVVPVVGPVVVAIRGTTVPRVVVPTPAPDHPVRPRLRTLSGCPIWTARRPSLHVSPTATAPRSGPSNTRPTASDSASACVLACRTGEYGRA